VIRLVPSFYSFWGRTKTFRKVQLFPFSGKKKIITLLKSSFN